MIHVSNVMGYPLAPGYNRSKVVMDVCCDVHLKNHYPGSAGTHFLYATLTDTFAMENM